MLARENIRRDKNALANPLENLSEKASDKMASQTSILEGIMHVDKDLTDWEDTSFRYSL